MDQMQHEFLQDEVNNKEDEMIGVNTGKHEEVSARTMKASVYSVVSLDDIQHQMLAEEIYEYKDTITPM